MWWDALTCATEVQAGVTQRNATVPDDRRIDFRIGINAGDVLVEDGDIFGRCQCGRSAKGTG